VSLTHRSREQRVLERYQVPLTRIGIVGCGYGAQVLVPAFRADPRTEVVAIAATGRARAQAAAQTLGIPRFVDDWRRLLDAGFLDALAIAAPPDVQTEIATAALECGLHVFAEKPLALTLDGARRLAGVAVRSGRAHAIDFNFREIAAMRKVRELLQSGTLGPLRHVTVVWQVESFANQARIESWKTDQHTGGGALSNFVSHALDYLEWLAGPIAGLSARLAGMPGDHRRNDTFVAMAFQFVSGAAGSLAMSAAAYRGSGHSIGFYGDNGSLVLENPGRDYMRGFELRLAVRPHDFAAVVIGPEDNDVWEDGRVFPSSRIVNRFLDWIQDGKPAEPNFTAGLRVQSLLEDARRSYETGQWVVAQPLDLIDF
jgi:predicted dehydrogenase